MSEIVRPPEEGRFIVQTVDFIPKILDYSNGYWRFQGTQSLYFHQEEIVSYYNLPDIKDAQTQPSKEGLHLTFTSRGWNLILDWLGVDIWSFPNGALDEYTGVLFGEITHCIHLDEIIPTIKGESNGTNRSRG